MCEIKPLALDLCVTDFALHKLEYIQKKIIFNLPHNKQYHSTKADKNSQY